MFNSNNQYPPFYSWSYNPTYMNQQAYLQHQAKIQAYEQQQSFEVANTVHKFKEYLDSAKKVDSNHAQELYFACLAVLANELKWNR